MAKDSSKGSKKASGGGSGNAVPINNSVTNAQAMTDAQADAMRQQEDSSYSASTTAAIKMYISNTDFDKQGHSLSQTMNFLVDNGVDLANADTKAINKQFGLNISNSDLASMQYTYSRMNKAFHPLGNDTILQRGAHDGTLQRAFGIQDYSKMSQAQLQQALVGKTFRNTSYMSASYDVTKNPFLGNGPYSGGREVVYNIKAGKNTPALLGAKKQSEIILGSTDWKITGVRYTNKIATPRGGSARPQIEIDIETF